MGNRQQSTFKQALARIGYLVYRGLFGAALTVLVNMSFTDFSGQSMVAAAIIGFLGGIAICLLNSLRP